MNEIDTREQSAKSAAILDNIKDVFALKGFEGASMQELARAAQMSVGNFYRYFPSKDAIITALVDRDMQQMRAAFEEVRDAADKPEALRALALTQICCQAPGKAALMAEIQASAFRNPEIAGICQKIDVAVRENIVANLRHCLPEGAVVGDAELAMKADVIMLLFKGLAIRRGLAEQAGVSVDALSERVLGMIMGIVNEGCEDAPRQKPAERLEKGKVDETV